MSAYKRKTESMVASLTCSVIKSWRSAYKFLKREFLVFENDKSNEIGELNLTYLLLAQRLVKEDAPKAMFRLGMSKELADLLGNLSMAQIVKLASSSLLLCRFRFDDHPILSTLAQDGKNLSLQQAHTAILLSGQQMAATH